LNNAKIGWAQHQSGNFKNWDFMAVFEAAAHYELLAIKTFSKSSKIVRRADNP
jgi:hypothetical protein